MNFAPDSFAVVLTEVVSVLILLLLFDVPVIFINGGTPPNGWFKAC